MAFYEQGRNYVTSPPSESAPDLADFHQRQGHAPRFAGKDRRVVYAGWDDAKVVQPDRCGEARGTSQRGSSPPAGGSDDPPRKLGPPLRPPWFFTSYRCRSRASNGHFSPSLFCPPVMCNAPPPLCVTGALVRRSSPLPARRPV